MVGPEEDDRIVGKPVIFQFLEDAADLHIHRCDQVVIPCPIPAHDGRVGVVGGQFGLRGLVSSQEIQRIFGRCGSAAWAEPAEMTDAIANAANAIAFGTVGPMQSNDRRETGISFMVFRPGS